MGEAIMIYKTLDKINNERSIAKVMAEKARRQEAFYRSILSPKDDGVLHRSPIFGDLGSLARQKGCVIKWAK